MGQGSQSTTQVAWIAVTAAALALLPWYATEGARWGAPALLHGFRGFRPQVRVAGVLLNRVGSPRHEEVLRSAAESAGLPVLGAIPRADDLEVPSRHLGLVTAVEHGADALRAVEAMTDVVEGSVDLDAVSR